MPDALEAQLQASLQLLAAEAPDHWARMRTQLSDATIRARVGDRPAFELCVAGEPPWIRSAVGPGAVEVALSDSTLDAFLHGSLTLEPALRSGALEVRGSLDDIRRLLAAFDAWLHGLLRAPSSDALYRDICNTRSRDLP